MQFVASKEKHKQVSLLEGLELLEQGKAKRLYSDGLDDYEYIYYDKNRGFYYEDNCFIGYTSNLIYRKLIALKWVLNYNFYVDKDPNEIEEIVMTQEKAR